MKTSNKLLVGLFLFVIASIFVVNLLLKSEISTNPLRNPAAFVQTDNTNEVEQDTLTTDFVQQ